MSEKLKFPDSEIDFVVTPLYFLGGFDIYDREESLGEYLDKYDPNDIKQLLKLFNETLFSGGIVKQYTLSHKQELFDVLRKALTTVNYDFESLVTHDRDPDDCFCLPWSWDFKNPRFPFEVAYIALYDRWGKKLLDSGRDVLPPAELNINHT